MPKSLRYSSLLVGLSLAAACSDLAGPKHQLTDDEATFLADQFAGSALQGVSSSLAGSPGMAGSPSIAESGRPTGGPMSWERTFTETRTCPAGGTVTNSGSNKGTLDATHSGTVEISHKLVMEDCARTRNEVTITVNTDPAITMAGTVTIENGHRTGGTFTKTGAFVWETSDGRSGRCEVDLTITWDGDSASHRGRGHTVTGKLCGREINGQGGRINGLGRKP